MWSFGWKDMQWLVNFGFEQVIEWPYLIGSDDCILLSPSKLDIFESISAFNIHNEF